LGLIDDFTGKPNIIFNFKKPIAGLALCNFGEFPVSKGYLKDIDVKKIIT